MGLRTFLCGLFDCEKFTNMENDVKKIGTDVVAILALVQAGLAPPLSWWIKDPGEVKTDSFTLELMVKGSQLWEFQAYGAEIVFDPSVLTLDGVDLGDLNSDWTMEGENEIEPGRWRFGAIPGTADPITGEVTGSIAKFNFTKSPGFTGETEIQIQNAVDDVAVLAPIPVIFKLKIGS